MVAGRAVVYDVACRGVWDWHVCVDGSDDPVSFMTRDGCIAAARQRAREHHRDAGVSTEVWAPDYWGQRECIVRYSTPAEFNELLLRARESSSFRREAATRPESLLKKRNSD